MLTTHPNHLQPVKTSNGYKRKRKRHQNYRTIRKVHVCFIGLMAKYKRNLYFNQHLVML